MKTSKTRIANGFGLLFLSISICAFTACKKDDDNGDPKPKPTVNIEGQYTGVGTDADDSPFLNGNVKLESISTNRLRVSGVGSTPITTFEVNVEYLQNQVVTIDGESSVVEIDISTTPYQLSFEGLNDETFSGIKQ
ncbi:hypothetical protein G3O08_10055 [Cryomorpha ignava]|uniref:Lipocalin-like domain-containing protein n=1 Tax=Cryomorpha ignava TaxID=101383 RepID=A0A7K3WQW0_9FLAO|nr:hypothetical protein [Cryomorpha ignava]NEN23844.1 hypothetical protein [Cryomorpha ignava]